MKNCKIIISFLIASILILSCSKNTDIDEQKQEEKQQTEQQTIETFRTTTLGGANSGFEIFHWRDEAGSGTHMDDSSAMPRYIKKCGAYTMSKVNAFEKSLTPAQKQVWREIGGENWLNAIKQLNFTVDNIDQIYDTIYNGASDVMCTLTQALPVSTDKTSWDMVENLYSFVYTFGTIANENFKQSGDNRITVSTDKSYNEKLNLILPQLKYCGMTTTDAENDIQNNNCAQIVAIYDQQLTTASDTVGLNFDQKQRALFTDIITSAQPVGQIHCYYASTSSYEGTKYKPNFSLPADKLDSNMQKAANKVYNNIKNQNSQMEQ